MPFCCRHLCLITRFSFTVFDGTGESLSPAGKTEWEGKCVCLLLCTHRHSQMHLLRHAPHLYLQYKYNGVHPACKILLGWKKVDSFSAAWAVIFSASVYSLLFSQLVIHLSAAVHPRAPVKCSLALGPTQLFMI